MYTPFFSVKKKVIQIFESEDFLRISRLVFCLIFRMVLCTVAFGCNEYFYCVRKVDFLHFLLSFKKIVVYNEIALWSLHMQKTCMFKIHLYLGIADRNKIIYGIKI